MLQITEHLEKKLRKYGLSHNRAKIFRDVHYLRDQSKKNADQIINEIFEIFNTKGHHGHQSGMDESNLKGSSRIWRDPAINVSARDSHKKQDKFKSFQGHEKCYYSGVLGGEHSHGGAHSHGGEHAVSKKRTEKSKTKKRPADNESQVVIHTEKSFKKSKNLRKKTDVDEHKKTVGKTESKKSKPQARVEVEVEKSRHRKNEHAQYTQSLIDSASNNFAHSNENGRKEPKKFTVANNVYSGENRSITDKYEPSHLPKQSLYIYQGHADGTHCYDVRTFLC
jgi:hypothetical protein